jgi:23S rRNA (uridine2552-2'-O)-methyltransferase
MKPTRTSKGWMREHVNDPWVKRAQAEGWRSRAAFKLIQIDDKDKLLRPGMTVVDLGATPGGWSQVAAARVGAAGKVIALDLLPLEPLNGVTFIQGDFRENEVETALEKALGNRIPDLVLSDMAPNISGVEMSDQARSIHLCELAMEFASKHLKPGGALLVKVFQGAGYTEFHAAMRGVFELVVSRKPDASRGRSSEMYMLGKGLKS